MTTDPILLRSNLWLTRGEHSLGGRGRVELLERIDQLGSIRQAALSMGMSYRVAWQAVEALNALSDAPVVTRETGGRGGGGAALSDHGRQLIRVFRLLEAEHTQFVERVNGKIARLMAA
jgi:molybdate transport system regulatory protein